MASPALREGNAGAYVSQQLSRAENLSFAENAVTVHQLKTQHQAEVLAFLAARPLHTVFMISFIRDNGLVSPLNRGVFYACRNAQGELEGVALIGHAILIEARTEAALHAFARLAHNCARAHVLMGEQESTQRFGRYFLEMGRAPRMVCRELMFVQGWPVPLHEPVGGLRLAQLSEVELIGKVNARFIHETSGVDPMQTDPLGFRVRLGRRIEQGRVWVWLEGGRLIFKTEIISDTPDVTYLEGIYVAPEARGKGYGLRCLSQLGHNLLGRTGAICLLVGERNTKAQMLYRRAGYKLCSHYDTVYL